MAGNYKKHIVPFGADLSKFESREEALALTFVPPKELVLAPVKMPENQAQRGSTDPCYGRLTLPSGPSTSVSMPALPASQAPVMRKLAGEKCLFVQLDPKPITVGKNIEVLPPKKGETIVDVVTTKDGDIAYAKYCQVKPRVTIKGVKAEPGQMKVQPKPPSVAGKKKKVAQPAEAQEENARE